MQFKEDAPVYTADGRKVGEIERFILEPRGRKIIGIIIREGFLFTQDHIVPIDSVESSDEERVILKGGIDPKTLPPFEEEYYIEPSENELTEPDAIPQDGVTRSAFYYYPPQGSLNWYGAAYPMPTPTEVVRNIPDDTIPLVEEAEVFSRDEEHVGEVAQIYTAADGKEVTHIKITQGLLFKKEKLLPISWVDNVGENEVWLAVTADTLKRLETE